MEKILTNQNLIDGLARRGHLSMYRSLSATGLTGEITWQGLELLAPLAQIPGTTLTGTLHAARAYPDTVNLLTTAWPGLTVSVDTWMIRDVAWDPGARAKIIQGWSGRAWINETAQAADGLILMEGATRRQRLDRTGENVTDTVVSWTLDEPGAAGITSLDLTGLENAVSLLYTDWTTGETESLLGVFPGLTEVTIGTPVPTETIDLTEAPAGLQSFKVTDLTSEAPIKVGAECEDLGTLWGGAPVSLEIVDPGSLEASGILTDGQNLGSLKITGLHGGHEMMAAYHLLSASPEEVEVARITGRSLEGVRGGMLWVTRDWDPEFARLTYSKWPGAFVKTASGDLYSFPDLLAAVTGDFPGLTGVLSVIDSQWFTGIKTIKGGVILGGTGVVSLRNIETIVDSGIQGNHSRIVLPSIKTLGTIPGTHGVLDLGSSVISIPGSMAVTSLVIRNTTSVLGLPGTGIGKVFVPTSVIDEYTGITVYPIGGKVWEETFGENALSHGWDPRSPWASLEPIERDWYTELFPGLAGEWKAYDVV